MKFRSSPDSAALPVLTTWSKPVPLRSFLLKVTSIYTRQMCFDGWSANLKLCLSPFVVALPADERRCAGRNSERIFHYW